MKLLVKTLSSLGKVYPEKVIGGACPSCETLADEPVSFQIAYRAEKGSKPTATDIRIECSDPGLSVTAYREEYVPLLSTCVADEFFDTARAGLFPDILRRKNLTDGYEDIACPWFTRRYPKGDSQPLTALSEAWQGLFFTVNENGEKLAPGTRRVTVVFYDATTHEDLARKTVSVRVLPAALSEKKLSYTCWFHADCLADIYGVPMFSEKHFAIMKAYLALAAKYGMTMALLPAFTPPLDTPIGGERMTAQLVDVTKTEGGWAFDFSRMERYMDMCLSVGITQFEHSHLFTQWGAEHAPKIIATVNGRKKRVFGWDTDANGEEYLSFLRAYLQKAVPFFDAKVGKENMLFHISDEPQEHHAATYRTLLAALRPYLAGCRVGDALSHYDVYAGSGADTPIVATDSPYIDRFRKEKDFWLYYTGGQAYDGLSNRLLSTTSPRNRILGVQLYAYGASGFLNWGYNFYYSFVSHGRFLPQSGADGFEGHAGGAFVVYPDTDGTPIPSLRMAVFAEGLRDWRALCALEEKIGREAVLAFLNGQFGEVTVHTCPNEAQLLAFRRALNEKLCRG